MAISTNKIILVGNVGSDPEQSGNGPVKFSVATSKKWKKDGQMNERTTWHKIVVWNEPIQKFVMEYLKKGDKVYVEGEMEYRVWEKDGGEKINIAEVVVHPYTGVVQVDSKSRDDHDTSGRSSRSVDREERPSSFGGSSGGRGGSGYGGRELDDEIPFAPEFR